MDSSRSHSFAPLQRRAIIAHVEPGDALLWDDRMLHGNCPGIAPPSGPDSPLLQKQLARAGAVVNMSPKKWASEEALQTRRLATERGVGNGHRSHHPIPRELLEAPAVSHASSQIVCHFHSAYATW